MALTEEELDMMINWDVSSLGRLFEQPAMNNNSDSSSSGQLGFRFQHHEPTAIQSPPLQTLIPPLETGTSSRGAPTQACSTNLSGPIVPLWIQHEQLRERALNLIQLRNSIIRRRRIHTRHGLTEADFAGLKEDKISKYLKIITHNNNIDDEKTVCAICLDNFCGKDMQVAIVDGCGHKFHACCLKRWLQRKNICPLCRRIAIRFL
ncbi:E3 ubiquitin-protein ligase MBR2 [Striga hermonthica]|uniref:RING-type E3 ubiquitin transferase n=1 Tax=Striga hermonthica TaxID=68872 RepID=A0A9N7RIN2_STRHE|nr:E3 ubiquitin-protein ligase MBR2 [Striga hermonthica]